MTIFCFNNGKLNKKLPKSWNNENSYYHDSTYGDKEFAVYAKKLYASLKGIKNYYEKEFNEDNIYTIDEYIALFNRTYNKFLHQVIDDEKEREDYFITCKKSRFSVENHGRFKIIQELKYRNPKFFEFKDDEIVGFSDEGYEKLKPLAKCLFMIEKICSFTTRKFWKNELTKIQDLDLKKPFKILAKCVFPYGWRSDGSSKNLDEYMNDRIYSSASLIDNEHKFNLFYANNQKIFAMLIMEYDGNNLICASPMDSYSEEKINGKNALLYKNEFSDALLQDETKQNGKNHKLYAEAVECETPKNILESMQFYSEVNLKNGRPVGVIIPNYESIDFASQEAEKRNLPIFILDKLK